MLNLSCFYSLPPSHYPILSSCTFLYILFSLPSCPIHYTTSHYSVPQYPHHTSTFYISSAIPHNPWGLTYINRQSRNNKDAVYLLEALAEGRYVQPSFLVDVHAPSVQGLYYGLGLREKKVVATSSTFSDSNVLNTMKGLYFRLPRLIM